MEKKSKGGKMRKVKKLSSVKDAIEAIRDEKEGFSFGEPWRYNEKSVTAVLPILRKNDKPKGYKLLVETENVKLEDTGSIDKVLIQNDEETDIFVRMGELLKGKTQERATVHSVVVEAGKSMEVEVRCVHASHPIAGSAAMKHSGYVPAEIEKSLCLDRQGGVWDTILDYSANVEMCTLNYFMAVGGGSKEDVDMIYAASASDNLREVDEKFGEVIKDVIKKVPYVENQVGLVIIDKNGVAGLEAFDLTEAWKMVRNAVTKGEGAKFTDFDSSGVFEYKPEKAVAAVLKALSDKFEESVVFEEGNSKTIRLKSEKYLGEATIRDGDMIHLRILRA